MGNPLLSFLSGSAGDGAALLMQAVGAAMRGESAQDFMTRLAQERPELRQVNLGDLQGSAQQLARQKGVNTDEITKKLDGMIEPMIKR